MTNTNATGRQIAKRWVVSALTLAFASSTAIPAFAQSAPGNIFNEATVNGTFGPTNTPLYAPGNEPSSNATVPLASPSPQYVATKSVSDPAAAVAGDVLNYTLTVQNTGNVSLTLAAADITDPGPTFGVSGPNALDGPFAFDSTRDTNADSTGDGGDLNGNGVIDPGETFYYVAQYTLQQADIDASAGITDGVNNTVTLDVKDAGGNTAPEDPGTPSVLTASATIDANPVLAFVKAAYDTAYSNDGNDTNDGSPIVGNVDAGTTVYYRFTVTNNSNVTANDIVVNETTFDINGNPAGPIAVTLVGGTAGDLDGEGDGPDIAPGGTAIYEATYTVTQSDIDG